MATVDGSAAAKTGGVSIDNDALVDGISNGVSGVTITGGTVADLTDDGKNTHTLQLAAAAAAANDNKKLHDSVRTLFITGLPADVRVRECRNLLRFFRGFEHAVLNLRGKSPVAFASFASAEDALAARDRLHGLRMDDDLPQFELRVQLAKQDSHKRSSPGGGSVHTNASAGRKRLPANGAPSGSPSAGNGAAGNARNGGDAREYPHHHMQHVAAQHAHMDARMRGMPQGPYYSMPGSFSPSNRRGGEAKENMNGKGLPNTTLFLANLGVNATEAEVAEVVSQQSGFRCFRWSPLKGGVAGASLSPPVAFVDFIDLQSAAASLQFLHGYMLPSSDPARGGLRVEYARSKMAAGQTAGGAPASGGHSPGGTAHHHAAAGGASSGAAGQFAASGSAPTGGHSSGPSGAAGQGTGFGGYSSAPLSSPIAVYGSGYTPFPGFSGAPYQSHQGGAAGNDGGYAAHGHAHAAAHGAHGHAAAHPAHGGAYADHFARTS